MNLPAHVGVCFSIIGIWSVSAMVLMGYSPAEVLQNPLVAFSLLAVITCALLTFITVTAFCFVDFVWGEE